MPWKRVTINLEPELAEIAKKRAKARRQSVAAYFATLLEQDIAGAVEESPQAPYGEAPPAAPPVKHGPHGFTEIPGTTPKRKSIPAPPHIQNPVQPWEQTTKKRA
jgi:hypothetical protein